ncbi:MAG TPA: winged helix-turn-helix domain-containing protein [Solirubrobacterales bacterium]|nr:winged helix-turn-helix domain-containing protein [Solirubrobacterales bacterium]
MESLSRGSGDGRRKVLAIGRDLGESGALRGLSDGAGTELLRAETGNEGLRTFYERRPDLVLLDLDLPDADGLDVLATMRSLSDVPVLALTGGEEEGRVAALRGGADDCVSKPPSPTELEARIDALLRRPRQGDLRPVVLTDEYVEIDRVRHRVMVLGREVSLTPIEFRMLATFAENPGRVLGHGQLLEMVWGDRIRERDEVKLYVSYLRRKLGGAADVDPVETVRGVGYRYRPRLVKGTNGNGHDRVSN